MSMISKSTGDVLERSNVYDSGIKSLDKIEVQDDTPLS